MRDTLAAQKRTYALKSVNDPDFVKELQVATDWLVARKVLPEPITVSEHLAKL